MKTISIPFSFFEIRAELYARLALRGIKDVSISWNDDFLRKIDLMEPGPEKEAAIDATVDLFAKMFVNVEEGHFVKKELPIFNDSLGKRANEFINTFKSNVVVEYRLRKLHERQKLSR